MIRHQTYRERARSVTELGEDIDDCLWSESDAWLDPSVRSYVVEERARIALALADERQRPGIRCRLCGSTNMSFPWVGSTRKCRDCGAYSHRMLEVVR